ncbi:MAG: MFS transporter, partial [Caulobacteraceae bacterium]|nr:MFS transporter [Caulobacter sp.]
MADALIGERSAAAPPSPGAAAYVLTLLTLIGVVNWADRSIVAILLDPIKRDLHASDTQMGLLNGFGFAVFYAVAAIPIARLADRSSRRDVLAWSLLAWSVLTAACGLAQSFAMLLLARFGVGAGESAAAPVSQALIVDYFPPRRRPLALSVQSSSIYIGTTLSAILGGYLGYRFGWRTALVAIGAPGLVLAALLRLTVREPARGRLDPVGSLAGAAPGFFPALRPLVSQPAFVLTVAATTLGAVVNGAMAAWTPAFFGRVYHLNLKELGLAYGVVKGLTGIAGVLAGGW